ncbi:TIGR02594 family protein [Sphingomonas sp. TDK1]|uniref:TIGR02594 family protein n=1 Tax=Sphingomonas sp. TDK1 TaxID=453247 RepID=UPI0007D9FAAF|nr:TIGR02594 family protein [Sphingomonas sp. TDK1]OAN57184.1 hypothetical protein A7X12_08135 [Sphingomonas sp. TDK1]
MWNLPSRFAFLRDEAELPAMVHTALDLLGTKELAGTANNPGILEWAKEINEICKRPYDNWAEDFFNADSIPWCGLFLGVVAARTCQNRPERMPPNKYLSALAWADWGTPGSTHTPPSIDDICLGDVIVLRRDGGGHVFLALGVSRDGKRIFGIGGNQSDAVTIADFDAERLKAVRRPVYNRRPAGARHIVLAEKGVLSVDEA